MIPCPTEERFQTHRSVKDNFPTGNRQSKSTDRKRNILSFDILN